MNTAPVLNGRKSIKQQVGTIVARHNGYNLEFEIYHRKVLSFVTP
jgi:hypothetical protein